MSADARPRLTLVQEALKAVPHAEKDEGTIAKVLAAFGPAYAKRARQEERDAYAASRENMAAKHAGELQGAEAAYRTAAHTAHKAGHAHGFWKGAGAGIVAGAALACLAIFVMQGVIWDTAARSFREQAMTGAMLSSQDDGQ